MSELDTPPPAPDPRFEHPGTLQERIAAALLADGFTDPYAAHGAQVLLPLVQAELAQAWDEGYNAPDGSARSNPYAAGEHDTPAGEPAAGERHEWVPPPGGGWNCGAPAANPRWPGERCGVIWSDLKVHLPPTDLPATGAPKYASTQNPVTPSPAADTVRAKPYLRDRRAGDPCDFGACTENAALIRVNPKGQPGIFMCSQHARISEAAQNPVTSMVVGADDRTPADPCLRLDCDCSFPHNAGDCDGGSPAAGEGTPPAEHAAERHEYEKSNVVGMCGHLTQTSVNTGYFCGLPADHPVHQPATAELTHTPCCSTHGEDMTCEKYRRTHFVEVGACCATYEANHQPATSSPPAEGAHCRGCGTPGGPGTHSLACPVVPYGSDEQPATSSGDSEAAAPPGWFAEDDDYCDPACPGPGGPGDPLCAACPKFDPDQPFGPQPTSSGQTAEHGIDTAACPTCQGRNRHTVDMVCMDCGRDYMPDDGSDETGPGTGWKRLMGAWREQARAWVAERDDARGLAAALEAELARVRAAVNVGATPALIAEIPDEATDA